MHVYLSKQRRHPKRSVICTAGGHCRSVAKNKALDLTAEVSILVLQHHSCVTLGMLLNSSSSIKWR